MKQAFLPIGLILALAFALWIPGPGIHAKHAGCIPVFIATIFFVNGLQLRIRGASLDRGLIVAFLASSVVSLGIGPFLGVFAAKIFGADPLMTLGLVVMASVPVTLSSAIVMVEISGGNRIWALLMTVGMNVCGIFSIPVMLTVSLGDVDRVTISGADLLMQLILTVLIPLLFGWSFQRPLSRFAGHPTIAYIPSLCVIFTVYAGFSVAREMMVSLSLFDGFRILGAAMGIHLALLFLARVIGAVQRLGMPERTTLLFVTSQKTMPAAIAVISAIAPDAAAALIPCLVFHFAQLILDSLIAARLSRVRSLALVNR